MKKQLTIFDFIPLSPDDEKALEKIDELKKRKKNG